MWTSWYALTCSTFLLVTYVSITSVVRIKQFFFSFASNFVSEFLILFRLHSLKAVLSAPLSSGTLDLSGIPLASRDMERLCSHLQRHAATVVSLELGFTELTDEAFLLLLPTLAALPHLETLALNGNRLTRTILKELTDALKVGDTLVRFDLSVKLNTYAFVSVPCCFTSPTKFSTLVNFLLLTDMFILSYFTLSYSWYLNTTNAQVNISYWTKYFLHSMK